MTELDARRTFSHGKSSRQRDNHLPLTYPMESSTHTRPGKRLHKTMEDHKFFFYD